MYCAANHIFVKFNDHPTRSICQPHVHSARVDIRHIEHIHDRLAADQLVRRMYAWRGYSVNNQASGNIDHDRITLGAWVDNELAATITVRKDGKDGLLCEALYPQEVAELREKKQGICEYSRLAIDPAFRSSSLSNALFKAGYDFARTHFGASDAVVEVNPRHKRFYERELEFTLLGPRRICPRVKAPALLLHRDLQRPFPNTTRANLNVS